MRIGSVLPAALLLLVVSPMMGWAKGVSVEAKDQPVLEQFLKHARNEAKALTREHCQSVTTPENFCWVELPKLGMSLTAVELTGDVEHLRDFVAGFENLQAVMTKGPEGFLSWYGSPTPYLTDPAKPQARICEIQTDFRAVGLLARFVELTGRNPEWAREFEKTRAAYLALMEDHLVKKWDADYFVDLGEKGAIYRWNKDYNPSKSNLTLAHEKQAIIIEALLNLYRASGRYEHLVRAAKLGVNLKACMQTKDDRYVWNYWDPMGDWDKAEGKWKHWVGREPKGMWFSATVGSAVLLYHHGIVFNEQDVQRLVRTQMQVCWNGDLKAPVFHNVDGVKMKEGERFVCPALAPWEPKLAELLYSGAWQEERIAKAANPWHGGVLAGEWLRGKYVELPGVQKSKPLYRGQGKELVPREILSR